MERFIVHTGRVAALPRANVDTDQIIPKQFLKRIERTGFGPSLFFDWRYLEDGSPNPEFVLNQPGMAGRQVLVAGNNFGCGSSREHAPWALLAWGVRAVIASSFADIFRVNSLKNGLIPVQVTPEELGRIGAILQADPDAKLTVDLEASELRLPDGTAIPFSIDAFARRMILDGTDELGYILAHEPELAAYEAAHPPRISTLA